jgi:hypothetical protein
MQPLHREMDVHAQMSHYIVVLFEATAARKLPAPRTRDPQSISEIIGIICQENNIDNAFRRHVLLSVSSTYAQDLSKMQGC